MTEDVRRAYDRWSATYDTQENPTRDLDAVVLRRLLPDPAGETIVEVGCGTGKNTAWLAPRCHRLVGLDVSAGMLAVARRKVQQPHVHFLRCDVRRPWPLPRQFATVVLINLVLEHIADLVPVFAGAARVMAPGAPLLISEFHPQRILSGRGARIDAEGPGLIGSFAHTVDDYEAAAGAVGLQIEAVQEWGEGLLRPGRGADDDTPLLLSLRLAKVT